MTPTAHQADRCEVVLFHSVLGVRAAVLEWAERLREAGHLVHVPSLYPGGEVFDDIAEAMRFTDSIGGIETLVSSSLAAVADLRAELVYAGFSNGAASAELLAATRPGARGAVLMHGAIPIHAFGVERWPSSVPAQLHIATGDPYREPAEDASFAESVRASGAALELFEYDLSGHLFADSGLPDHHAASAKLMLERTLEFLERVSAARSSS